MKAPLLIGSNVSSMSLETLSILSNAEAISINQDPLGIQARRVAIAPPPTSTLSQPFDVDAVLAACSTARPTQIWTFVNQTVPGATQLWQEQCKPSDASQAWVFGADGTLRNAGTGLCVDAPLHGCSMDAVQLKPCNPASATQQWGLATNGNILAKQSPTECLDIPDSIGPAVSYCGCHAVAASNQQWAYNSATRTLTSFVQSNWCMTAATGPQGGLLRTVDGDGVEWCLGQGGYDEGSWHGVPCDGKHGNLALLQPVASGPPPPPGSPGNYTFDAGQSSLGFSNQPGASGPLPHTRYLTRGSPIFTATLTAPSPIKVADGSKIRDDDGVGGVTLGGDFCLDLVSGGGLEVWAGPLVGGRIAISLWNRSPAQAPITARWVDIGATGSYAVRDVWAAADVGVHAESYTAPAVAPHGVALLILTQQ